jgi:hypothetical protein
MARAFIGNVECRVDVDQDLGDTWAVTVVPPPGPRGQPVLPPLVVKLQGVDREKSVVGALEILKKAGKIDRFEP